jgi:signal transduction histidine kinase
MHAVAWLRARPRVADVLFVVFLAAFCVTGDLTVEPGDVAAASLWVSIPLTLVSCGSLLWRRTRPGVPVAVTAAVVVGAAAANAQWSSSGIALIVALYAVAAHGERRQSLRWLAATLVGIAFVLASYTLRNDQSLAVVDVVSNGVVFVTAWALGDGMRSRRIRVAALEEQAEALERQRAGDARRAVNIERGRIARELHDVVAHHVSVMVIQAGAARRVIDANPGQAAEALASIETVGRQALDELRRVLGVLRAVPEVADGNGRAPQPGLVGVDGLADQVREAGLAVDVRVEGEARPLPVGVDVSAYRIVQEALTNALKHAGPAKATVTVRYGDDDVELEVVDDGRGASSTDGGGHGLLGMRERVELFGGDLRAGPRVGGGYAVRARLPVR